MNLRQTSDKTCAKLVTRPVSAAAVIILGLRPVLSGAKAIAPKEYPPGKEPYYNYSENSAWYDSYGRLRYGPRGIPAEEYRARKGAEAKELRSETGTGVSREAVTPSYAGPVAGGQATQPPATPAARPAVPWKRMFWPEGIPPSEAHKGLIDWH